MSIPINKIFDDPGKASAPFRAAEVDFFAVSTEDAVHEETIKVTIALEEYRSLVRENTRLQERIAFLEIRLAEEIKKNMGAVNDGKM